MSAKGIKYHEPLTHGMPIYEHSILKFHERLYHSLSSQVMVDNAYLFFHYTMDYI